MIPADGRDLRALHGRAAASRSSRADTVYGLACDAARRARRVERLYALKGRRAGQAGGGDVLRPRRSRSPRCPSSARARAPRSRRLLPGAVTLLLPNPARRFPLACGPDPDDARAARPRAGRRRAAALAAVRWPVLQSTPTTPAGPDARRLDEVPEPIRAGADLVLDAGELPGTPSTVVDLRRYEDDAAPGRRPRGRGRGRAAWRPTAVFGYRFRPRHEDRRRLRPRRLPPQGARQGALLAAGHEVIDVGTESPSSVDYPRFAEPAARLVAAGEADRGVLACGSGVGVAIVANKVAGVRAVNAHDAAEAEMARRHNDANVVTLSGARLAAEPADAIVARSCAPPSRAAATRAASTRSPRSSPQHRRIEPHDRAAARLLQPPARRRRPRDRRRARARSSSASSARWR